MILLPAIDLYEGKAVRLVRGDYRQMTLYSEHPEEQAKAFADQGAAWLHVVDLEGAKEGTTPNFSVVAQLCRTSGLRVEIGGGIRDTDTIARYLDIGAERVILGTKAVTDPDFLEKAVTMVHSHIAVGVDILDGAIAIHGWQEKSTQPVENFFGKLCEMGVQTVICTDISKDGMLGGTNVTLYRDLSRKFALDLIASGGVSSLQDIRSLKELGLYGAILGKALYTGALSLKQALKEVV